MSDSRVRVLTGSLATPGVAAELIDRPDTTVLHLASMVSGDTEAAPQDGWTTNVEGQRLLLEALRESAPDARFLFTSSTATLGPVASEASAPDDTTKLLPLNTYGFHKAVCELMINDYSRRGGVDARGLRLPVIVVRPGAPNAALTGAWSTVVREPLAGRNCTIPVPLDAKMPIASYQSVVQAMETLLNDVESEDLGPDRTLMLPSISASPRDLIVASAAAAEANGIQMGRVVEDISEVAARIVGGMGSRTDGSRALALGVKGDIDVESIVRAYMEDYVLPPPPGLTS
uniref:NAD-dependent epimerase/dehydratase domain-containing protein n=1 Tax=Haptolina ericina TaxID=156174 RepID=A0A7S3B2G1_9EUKA